MSAALTPTPTRTVTLDRVDRRRAAWATLPRGATVGRYVILDPVGAGGMGVVYAAYDPELDRKVALKLLLPGRCGEAARGRLLREAQAVARLSHPNVVAVHDAGTHGEQVFIALELVQGRTLRQWLSEERRPWREILAVLRDAGQGLAAAHAAGLVHRDVKPDNVLIGDDGRVRMADFGIARLADGGEEPGPGVGTPAYMAPEQRRGEPADARSDQLAFCVTLWEALFGARPPAGEDRRVPSWLRQALLRGLSADPAERHPSLEHLLAILGRDPAVIRRRWLAAAAVLLAAGGSGLAWERGRESRVQLCQAGEERLAGVWDGARRQAVRTAFAATGAPRAGEIWSRVSRGLDRYAADWVSMYREVCEATWLRGEQSEDLLDRRMLCLEQRRRDLDALARLFARADPGVVAQAEKAVGSLAALDGCADRDTLLRRTPAPGDPAVRARLAEVETRLSEGRALFWAGRYGPALAVASRVVREADALAFAPLQAESHLLLGDIQEARGDYPRAEGALYQAVWAADRGADDAQRAWVWKKLAYVVGYREGRIDEAIRLLRHGRAALARAGRRPRVESSLLNIEAGLFVLQQRYGEAAPLFRQALAVSEREDPDDPKRYVLYANLGEVLLALGEAEQSLAYQRRAFEAARRHLPEDHPTIAALHFNTANALMELERYGEAVPILERVLASREARLGPDHPDVAETLSTLGAAWNEQGRPGRALPLLRRALALYEAQTPPGYPYRELARHNLGRALSRLRQFREAEAHLQEALGSMKRSMGEENPLISMPLLGLSHLRLDQGRFAEAVPLLRRAIEVLDRSAAYPSHRAEAGALLAQALRESGREALE